jgi:hypothetical protein
LEVTVASFGSENARPDVDSSVVVVGETGVATLEKDGCRPTILLFDWEGNVDTITAAKAVSVPRLLSYASRSGLILWGAGEHYSPKQTQFVTNIVPVTFRAVDQIMLRDVIRHGSLVRVQFEDYGWLVALVLGPPKHQSIVSFPS